MSACTTSNKVMKKNNMGRCGGRASISKKPWSARVTAIFLRVNATFGESRATFRNIEMRRASSFNTCVRRGNPWCSEVRMRSPSRNCTSKWARMPWCSINPAPPTGPSSTPSPDNHHAGRRRAFCFATRSISFHYAFVPVRPSNGHCHRRKSRALALERNTGVPNFPRNSR